MPNDSFQRFGPGDRLTAGLVNAHSDALERHDRLFVSGGLATFQTGAGTQVYDPTVPPFWARLTDKDGGDPQAYSWAEQTQLEDGVFSDLDGGRSGTADAAPAYEANNQDVDLDQVVLLWPYNGGSYYEFDRATGGGSSFDLTVREEDEDPSYSDVDTLTFAEVDGFSLSQPADGEALVNLVDASRVQRGIVGMEDQNLGQGVKTADQLGLVTPGGNPDLDAILDVQNDQQTVRVASRDDSQGFGLSLAAPNSGLTFEDSPGGVTIAGSYELLTVTFQFPALSNPEVLNLSGTGLIGGYLTDGGAVLRCTGYVDAGIGFAISGVEGWSGTYATGDARTVTVVKGLIMDVS